MLLGASVWVLSPITHSTPCLVGESSPAAPPPSLTKTQESLRACRPSIARKDNTSLRGLQGPWAWGSPLWSDREED